MNDYYKLNYGKVYLTFRCCVENLLHTMGDWQVERQAIALWNKFVTPWQKQYFSNEIKYIYIKRRSNNRKNNNTGTNRKDRQRKKSAERFKRHVFSLERVRSEILFFNFFFGLLVRLSLYIRKSAGAVGVLFYRLWLCAGGVVVPHTFTCPPVS